MCQNLDCFLDSVARNRTLAMLPSHLASECKTPLGLSNQASTETGLMALWDQPWIAQHSKHPARSTNQRFTVVRCAGTGWKPDHGYLPLANDGVVRTTVVLQPYRLYPELSGETYGTFMSSVSITYAKSWNAARWLRSFCRSTVRSRRRHRSCA